MSSSLEDWLARLQREEYEIKWGKYVFASYIGVLGKPHDFAEEGGATKRASFSPQDRNEQYALCDYAQERPTWIKSLATDYTEEAVSSRIAGGPRPSKLPQQPE